MLLQTPQLCTVVLNGNDANSSGKTRIWKRSKWSAHWSPPSHSCQSALLNFQSNIDRPLRKCNIRCGIASSQQKTPWQEPSERDLGDLYAESGQSWKGSFSAVSKPKCARKMRWKALAEVYKMHSLHCSKIAFFPKKMLEFCQNLRKISEFLLFLFLAKEIAKILEKIRLQSSAKECIV